MTERRWLVLEPHDTVAVRDGRAFDAGTHSVARAVVPHPGTVAGAVGAAYGARPGAGADPAERGRSVPAELHGPVVVQRRGGSWRPLFPAPRVMVHDRGRWVRLRPPATGGRPGVRHDLGDMTLLAAENDVETDHVPGGWVGGDRLRRFLHDPDAPAPLVDAPWTVERRVGLARDGDRTARDGMLYAAEHLRPVQRAGVDALGFAVGCASPPPRQPRSTVFFGGEGRRATVRTWEDAGQDGPLSPPPDTFDRGRLLIYLATPALFADGWRPAAADLRGARLAAAAVGGPEAIAMGRPDRGSGGLVGRRLTWCAAAGSIYFLQFDDEAAALEAARDWHGRGFPQDDEVLRTAGFGLALIGRW